MCKVVFILKIFCIFFSAGLDWVDPEDPIVIAETQLLGAANAIEAAARKLEQLQPRRSVKVSPLLVFALAIEFGDGGAILISINALLINTGTYRSIDEDIECNVVIVVKEMLQ